MKRNWVMAALLAGALAGCVGDATAPGGGSLYRLRRIGTQPLPAPSYPSPDAPLIVADSLLLTAARVRSADDLEVTRITIQRSGAAGDERNVNRYRAALEGDLLIMDNCPVGSFCIASLVYAPSRFLIVGDSLFEQLPQDSPLLPRVYGLVRR